MGSVLKKNFPSATCQKCGEVTDIQLSSSYRNLVTQNTTLKDLLRVKEKNLRKILTEKNGIIQSLHKSIFQLNNLMTEKQKEKAKEISQSMREYVKRSEKQW